MADDRGAGWERERRTHFDEIVAGYDEIRPAYPEALLADILRYTGGKGPLRALEIGAGTGKATDFFLGAGFDVTAVEIGANMAAFLREKFQTHNDFRVLVASFEEAPLEDNSYDLLYAASAFHWVDARTGCPKAFRLLESGGTVALFRYLHIPADGDPLYEAMQAVYQRYYHRPYVRPIRRTGEALWQPAEVKRTFGFEDLAQYGFTDLSMTSYSAARQFTADTYIALLETFSDHRSLPEDDRSALYAGVREAIARHGGCLTAEYIFQLYMGRKP